MNSLSHRPASLSTLSSLQGHRRGRGDTLEEQRARLLVYLGTLLLVTGLVLLFIGVGASVSYTRTVGLLFIASGSLMYLVKVCITPENHHTIVRRARLVGSRDSLYSVPPVHVQTQETVPEEPAQEEQHYEAPRQDCSPTPTSTNGVGVAPETQVLIPEGRF